MPKARELKVRIDDLPALMVRLDEMGAVRGDRRYIRNVYYRQPPGQVLKISSHEEGDSLVRLRAVAGGFELVSTQPVGDVDVLRRELAHQYGEKSLLTKEETRFAVPGKSYELLVTAIANVGTFLVLLDDDPHLAVVVDDFKILDPTVIDVPFDELLPEESSAPVQRRRDDAFPGEQPLLGPESSTESAEPVSG